MATAPIVFHTYNGQRYVMAPWPEYTLIREDVIGQVASWENFQKEKIRIDAQNGHAIYRVTKSEQEPDHFQCALVASSYYPVEIPNAK